MNDRTDLVIKLIGAVVFQILWVALVMTAGSHWSAVVAAGTAVLVLLQLALCPVPFFLAAAFVALAGVIGLGMDTLLTAVGILTPVRVIIPFPVAPLWLIGLWIAFSGFLQVSLTYLRGRPVVQWWVGAVGGPMAYWSGARLGAVELNGPLPLALGVLALSWGAICILFFALSSRMAPVGKRRTL